MDVRVLTSLGGGRFGPRFALTGQLPTITLVLFIGLLLESGAPGAAPNVHLLSERLKNLSATEAVVLAAAILGLAVILQPLQQGIVRTLEGYPEHVVGQQGHQRVRMDQIGGAKFTEPPLLVVETQSPSTALVDLNRKKAACERFRVPSYWIVNPDPPQPELTVFELLDGRYAVAAKTSRHFTADRPLTVTIAPAGLIDGLRH